jgi:hypothetical protein
MQTVEMRNRQLSEKIKFLEEKREDLLRTVIYCL